MRRTSTALMLATAALLSAAPAGAAFTQDAQAQGAPTLQPSKGAQKAIFELQTAVNANDTASIPAKVAAAQAAAKTAEDRYLIAALQLRAALAVKDNAGIASSIEAILATGKATPTQVPQLRAALMNAYFDTQQFDKAAAVGEQIVAAEPANTDAILSLVQIRDKQGRKADAVAALQKAISAVPAGTKADEKLYRHAVQIAYDAKLPSAVQIARDWLRAYPSADSWRNSLSIYRNLTTLDEAGTLDVLRLMRATGGLMGDADHYKLASTALQRGYPGEAKAVLEEAAAARRIDPAKQPFAELIGQAKTRVAGDRESLAASAAKATNARQLMAVADAYYGYGDFAEAAKLYRQSFAKPGADADLLNLRLGMALALAGDKAGATTAFNAVTGPRLELAKFWLVYLATRA